MDTKITEIEILLDKLNLLFESIKNDGQIDKLEMQLLKKYVQQLHDATQALGAPIAFVQPEIKPEIKQDVKPELPIKEPIAPPVVEVEKIVEKIIPTVEPIKEPVVEKKVEIVPPVIVPPAVIEPPVVEKKEMPINKSEEKKKLIAQDDEDSDEEYNSGLNNKLFKDKKTLADKISSSKAKDLKQVIDLNEKLFFISKLFKGDKDAYDQSIKALNNFSNFNDAERFISTELKMKFQWNDAVAIERLIDVLRAKFE